jgi:hypothetical protein
MNSCFMTPNEMEIYEVNPKRLQYGVYDHAAQRETAEGDITSSYSADVNATNSKVRMPFKWRGDVMVVVGTGGNGGVQQAEAYRLTPVLLFKGTPTTYREKTGTEDGAEAARNDAKGFYHAMTVRLGTIKFVLTGPPIRFIAATLAYFSFKESRDSAVRSPTIRIATPVTLPTISA